MRKVCNIFVSLFIFMCRVWTVAAAPGSNKCPKCGLENKWVGPVRRSGNFAYWRLQCSCGHKWRQYL